MLRRIQIQNFMSLRDVTVDLSPLTIFIGPNASGKSAVFKALVTLTKLLGPIPVRGPHGEFALEPGVTLDYLVWQGNSGLPITFRLWWGDDPDDEPGYTLELVKRPPGWSVMRERLRLDSGWIDTAEQPFEHGTERVGPKSYLAPYRATLSHLAYAFRNDQIASPLLAPLFDLRDRVGDNRRYRVSASDIAAFAKTRPDQESYVLENGWGLPLALQDLQGSNRELFGSIEHELSQIFNHIRFINFRTERFGVGLAFTTHRSEDLVPASQESDGVLHTAFLLWRLYTASRSLRICLEEPENGLHPYLLGERWRLLKRFAYGKGKNLPVQVLVATHSPDLLTAIEEREEILAMVRVVEFDSEQGTKIHNLGHFDQIHRLLDAFNDNIGELWWSGGIGAIPPHVDPGCWRSHSLAASNPSSLAVWVA